MMAGNSTQGGMNWAQSLPPKSPSTDSSAFLFSSTGSSTSSSKHEPSAGYIAAPQPAFSWIDDMLDSPEAAARKIHHRRSASDTAAFLDIPDSSGKHEVVGYRPTATNFERLDDEQIMSMFGNTESEPRSATDRIVTSDKAKLPDNSHFPTSPSDSNSGNEMSTEDHARPLKTEPEEVQSVTPHPTTSIAPAVKHPTASTHIDPNIDPKRAKRILANRQSAQRSRVRKLHYIAELERSVTALQTEVSALTPQVAFLDHQRVLLNVDNNNIKQRIASLMQDKRFKDAHNEALTREVHRLRQLLQEQEEMIRSQVFGASTEGMTDEVKQNGFGLKIDAQDDVNTATTSNGC